MEDYIKQLNKQQQDAVLYTDGPQLVIAGAGSGKTRVLTYKIMHLLMHGYEPWRILALTFTNKAACEMRQRIETVAGSATARKLWMGTFHSIFLKILRINADRIGYKKDFTIYDATDSRSLIKNIIKDMGLDEKIYKPSIIANAISMAKNSLMSPDMYAVDKDITEADRRARRPHTADIYRAYCQRCLVAGAMDFDDILLWTYRLLDNNEDIRRHYVEFFRYILVDEYQDTNYAQHRIITLLTDSSPKLCVVGDDAQSIYSFRGANIANILNLKCTFPELRTFKLERNYRSTQNITNAANSLIEKNKSQIPKKVYSDNKEGSKLELVQSYSDFEEGYLVANRINQLKMQQHDSYEDYAILYRTNSQSRILEEQLRKRNIPYRIYGGLSFYQRKEIKDALCYFRLAVNPDDDEALRRIINFPARGIGDTTLARLTRTAIDAGVSLWKVISEPDTYTTGLKNAALNKLNSFHQLITGFIELNADGTDAETLARRIITDTGLLSMLVTDRTPESVSKQENLTELVGGINEFVQGRLEEDGGSGISMSDFLGEVSLATDQDSDNDQNQQRVTMMTVHAAKGLEFSNVFIVGLEEDLFPSAMASSTLAEIEEERRLLYVAITRAKNNCIMSYASSRYRNGQTMTCTPSRFLKEIAPQYIQGASRPETDNGYRQSIKPTDRYRHGSYASGADHLSAGAGISSHRNLISSQSIHASLQPAAADGATHSVSELAEGMRIEHSRFGAGTITQVVDDGPADAIHVVFDTFGPKKLLLKFARFNIK